MGRKGIPMENGRGQGYDGGSHMAGKHNGVQAFVKKRHPKKHFHWCDGDCLNLCTAKACEQVKRVVDHIQSSSIAFEYPAKKTTNLS